MFHVMRAVIDTNRPIQRILLATLLYFFNSFFLSACGLEDTLEREQLGNFGYFEYRPAKPQMTGVVIGAPHGGTDPGAALMARLISERIGTGLVIANGFKSRRVSVAQPIARTGPASVVPGKRHSVFREFNKILHRIAGGEVNLYIELRTLGAKDGKAIDVVSSGFTFEEAGLIKQSFLAAFAHHDHEMNGVTKLSLSLDPGEGSWDTWGIRHHGALMVAEKGLILRMPEEFLSGEALRLYGEILAAWIKDITHLSDSGRGVPRIEIKLAEFGRFDLISSRAGPRGVVIGAPHGSYDAYTAGMVKQLAFRTGFAAVIARGFTPTETGDGRRINVNRPSERYVWASGRDYETERARTTYEQFKSSVLSVAGGNLELYIDIHQNSGTHIEVATAGLSREEARIIKDTYLAARDQARAGRRDIAVVDLAIEPLDRIEVGAWAAKVNGILGVASRSMHFELPADSVMSSVRQRRMYTLILGQMIKKLPSVLRLNSVTVRRGTANHAESWQTLPSSLSPRSLQT